MARTLFNNSRSRVNYPFAIITTKPITLKLVIIATIFIAGSILYPFLLLLLSSSPSIAYGQATSNQKTPEQALSSPSLPQQQQPFSPGSTTPFSNQTLQQALQQALSAPPQTPLSPLNQTTTQQQGQPPQVQPPLPPASSTVPGLLPPTEQQPSSQPPPPPPTPLQSQQQQIQPPIAAPTQGLTTNGTIDSLIFAPATRWIATGNWSMVLLNGNVNSFSTNMTWYNNNGTGTHTHELLNLRVSPTGITQEPGDNILIRGLMDVGTNHRITWTNVPSTIDIKGGKTISISLDDIKTNRHFSGQTIYGIVKSFTRCSDQPGENMEVLVPCTPLLS